MSEFKNKTEKELAGLVAEKRESLRAFKFGTAGSKTRNVKESATIKRDIARILTELTARGNK